MKRQGMSERQYAAHAGITRGAVSKARCPAGWCCTPDGSIDIAGSDQRMREVTDPTQQRGTRASLQYKRLEGTNDQHQIQINDQYRVIFTIGNDCAPPVITIFDICDPH